MNPFTKQRSFIKKRTYNLAQNGLQLCFRPKYRLEPDAYHILVLIGLVERHNGSWMGRATDHRWTMCIAIGDELESRFTVEYEERFNNVDLNSLFEGLEDKK